MENEIRILNYTLYILHFSDDLQTAECKEESSKDLSVWEGPAAYQLVGEVTAHQDYDG